MTDSLLLQKYNVPAPRYTSYPTVPYWDDNQVSEAIWIKKIQAAFFENSALSLYIHLPYCEKLCTYCGCNKHITKNHAVALPYIKTVLQEWKLYVDNLPTRPTIKELHLGGGTPTFFSPAELEILLTGIFALADIAPNPDFGFEAHPFSASYEHLAALAKLGFRRISVGVQDFEPEILNIINRQQTEQQVRDVTRWARELEYTSINYDLIYGLPLQTLDHIRMTMGKIRELMPERIAFYSYAHVPWIKPSQRAYSEADLPQGVAKRYLYELGREMLEDLGYVEIGMDHFALPTDSLYLALKTGTLHRNFMGYTHCFTQLSIALGASSISDSGDTFVQNEKNIQAYQAVVASGHLPITRGHILTNEDEVIRHHILELMCRFETHWKDINLQCEALFKGVERLQALEQDSLVVFFAGGMKITDQGRPFLRNICMALDARYWQRQPEAALFSQAV
jgi:oxygen-independent coproporphyrinogen-3 oxidase